MPAASTPGSALTRSRDLLEDHAALCRARVAGRGAVVVLHFDRGGTVGLEAEIDVEHLEEAAHQQSRADQQHAGQGDFRDDQRAAHALMLLAFARTGPAVLERFLQVAAGHLQSGSETEKNGRGDGDKQRPYERACHPP